MSKVQHHFSCCFHLFSFVGTFSSSLKQLYATAKKIFNTTIACFRNYHSSEASCCGGSLVRKSIWYQFSWWFVNSPVNSLIMVMIFTSLVGPKGFVEGCATGISSQAFAPLIVHILTRIYHWGAWFGFSYHCQAEDTQLCFDHSVPKGKQSQFISECLTVVVLFCGKAEQ